MKIKRLQNKFASVFNSGKLPTRLFFAPGRVNLIGEHTDYNGGHVFPAAISYGTYAIGMKRTDKKFRFYSMNFPETGIIECDLDRLNYDEKYKWANYPIGMIHYLKESGADISSGIDLLFYGTIPNNAGLSSSASIELVTGVLFEGIFNLHVSRIKMIHLGQKVENDFIGVKSGIMDQFAIGMGKKDHAIHLNTDTLAYTYAPISTPNHSIIIINSNKKRALAESKYNDRRAECEQALADLQKGLNIKSLGDLTPEQFEAYAYLIKDPVHKKRAKHVIYENDRTIRALEKLNDGDLAGFGVLMNESHRSLQEDYEVTGFELDTIVEAAQEQDGVLGARMTGAGFGGCAIAIVEKESIEQFKRNVKRIYQEKSNYEVTFYTATISDGARELKRADK